MIQIDLELKAKNAGLTLAEFLESYSSTILLREHNTRWNGIDRFNLGHNTNRKFKLHEIFYDTYQCDRELRDYIRFVFSVWLNTYAEASALLERILTMPVHEIDSYIRYASLYGPYNARLDKVINTIFSYDRDGEYIRKTFSQLDFSTCYYCNRNYINSFTLGKTKKALFTLDHYHQKNRYPIFALSVYNLVPSCSSCNTNVKGKRTVEQYKNPYCSDYDFHNKAKFTLLSTSTVRISSRYKKCQKYIDDFYINEIYEHHQTEIKEFVSKRMVFTDEVMDKLSEFTGLSLPRIKSIAFGDVIQRDHLDIEPLSKLKVDIAKELKIIL